MSTMRQRVADAASDVPTQATAPTDTIEERRARRMEALRKVAGMWQGRTDIPADGLEYQRALRAEWR